MCRNGAHEKPDSHCVRKPASKIADLTLAQSFKPFAAPVFLLTLAMMTLYSGAWIVRDVIFGVSPIPIAALRVVGAPLMILGLLAIAVAPLRAARLAYDNLALVMLILWAGLSVLWSVDPGTSFQRVLTIAVALIAAAGLVLRFSPKILAQLVVLTTCIGMSLSLMLWLSGDALAVDQIAGGVRGAFTHKNVLGQITAIGTLLGIGLLQRPGARLLGAAAVVLGVICLMVARSATAIASTMAGILILYVLAVIGSRRLPPFVKPAMALAGLVGGVLFVLAYPLVLEALGRDASLTGRDQIWQFTLDRWEQRPWLGHGFRAFWTADYNRGLIASNFWARYDQSHNGYLQILLDLGLVGLGLFLAWLVSVLARSLRLLGDPDLRMWISLWAAFIVYSFTEAIYLTPNGFTWLVIMLAGMVTGYSVARPASRYGGQASTPLSAVTFNG